MNMYVYIYKLKLNELHSAMGVIPLLDSYQL